MLKNAIAYSVVPSFQISPEFLERRPARDCAALESATDGFVAPCEHSTAGLVHHVAGYSLICWQTEDKILPGSVVEEAVDEKVTDIERDQGRRVGRKERKEIKEKCIDELLPRAFVQKRRTFGLLDPVRCFFIVDTSSPVRAEKMLEAMRKALGVMPMLELKTEAVPSAMMAAWISSGEAPLGMSIDDECLLEGATDTKEQVRYARTMALAEDVQQRVAHGFIPRQLGMTWSDKVSFVLSSEIHLRRLSFLGLAKLAADPFEDEAARFDAEVTIAAGETTALIERLVEHFGGLKKPEAEPDLLTDSDVGAAARRLNDMLAADGATATLSGPDGKVIATFGAQEKLAELNDRLGELAPDVAYDEAKRAVIAEQRASISFVQSTLRIGYNAAARMIERMEADGIVSAMNANGAREVLVKESAHA